MNRDDSNKRPYVRETKPQRNENASPPGRVAAAYKRLQWAVPLALVKADRAVLALCTPAGHTGRDIIVHRR